MVGAVQGILLSTNLMLTMSRCMSVTTVVLALIFSCLNCCNHTASPLAPMHKFLDPTAPIPIQPPPCQLADLTSQSKWSRPPSYLSQLFSMASLDSYHPHILTVFCIPSFARLPTNHDFHFLSAQAIPSFCTWNTYKVHLTYDLFHEAFLKLLHGSQQITSAFSTQHSVSWVCRCLLCKTYTAWQSLWHTVGAHLLHGHEPSSFLLKKYHSGKQDMPLEI